MSSISHKSDDPNNPNQNKSESCEEPGGDSQTPLLHTLGIFVKEPVSGKVKTRLGAEIGCEESARLYELFVKDLTARFQPLSERLIMGYSPNSSSAKRWVESLFVPGRSPSQTDSRAKIDTWPQPQGELGERMSAYFEHAFAFADTESAVLIGSDSPTIPAEYVQQAFEWLYRKDCVIGPSADGGYYLIGLRIPCEELFKDICWSRSGVLLQTVEKIKKAGLSLKLLPVWYDIDSKDDLQMLKGHLSALEISGDEDIPRQTHQWVLNWNTER